MRFPWRLVSMYLVLLVIWGIGTVKTLAENCGPLQPPQPDCYFESDPWCYAQDPYCAARGPVVQQHCTDAPSEEGYNYKCCWCTVSYYFCWKDNAPCPPYFSAQFACSGYNAPYTCYAGMKPPPCCDLPPQ